MKKLFPSAFFAFATLAFANCTNDVADLNGDNLSDNSVETLDLTINASTGDEDSRTYLEPSDGNTYKMCWNKSNELSLALVELTEESKTDIMLAQTLEAKFENLDPNNQNNAVFRAALPVNNGHESYEYLACYPHDALYKFVPGEKLCVTLPAEQAAQVIDGDDNNKIYAADPKASLMFAKHRESAEGAQPYRLKLKFDCISAYGKMTIKNLMLEQANVKTITITANDDDTYLAGPWCYTYNNSSESGVDNSREGLSNSIVIDVEKLNIKAGGDNKVPDFTIYFAMLPVNMTEFTVTVTDSKNNTYYKVCKRPNTAEDPVISFKAGVVKGFGVDFAKDVEAKKLRVYKRMYSSTLPFESSTQSDFNSKFGSKKYLLVGKGTDGNQYVMSTNSPTGSGTTPTAVILKEAGFTSDGDDLLHEDDENASLYSWMFEKTTNDKTSSLGAFKIYRDSKYWYRYTSSTPPKFYLNATSGFMNNFNVNSDDASTNGFIIYGSSALTNYVYTSGTGWALETNSNSKRYFDIYEDTGELKDMEVAGGGDDDEEWPVEGKEVYQKVDATDVMNGSLSGTFLITADYDNYPYTMRNDETSSDNTLSACSMVLYGFTVDNEHGYILHNDAKDYTYTFTWGSYSIYGYGTFYGYSMISSKVNDLSSDGYAWLYPGSVTQDRANLFVYTTNSYGSRYWIPANEGGGIKVHYTNSSGTCYIYFDTDAKMWYATRRADWATPLTFYKFIGKKTQEEFNNLTK